MLQETFLLELVLEAGMHARHLHVRSRGILLLILHIIYP